MHYWVLVMQHKATGCIQEKEKKQTLCYMQLNTIRASLRKRVICCVSTRACGPKGFCTVSLLWIFCTKISCVLPGICWTHSPCDPALFPLLLLVFKASSLLPDVNIPCLLFARVVTLSLAALHCSWMLFSKSLYLSMRDVYYLNLCQKLTTSYGNLSREISKHLFKSRKVAQTKSQLGSDWARRLVIEFNEISA